ncbi:MAG: hypothetical protein K6T88_20245, partial [Bacillus sp. (in: Bacteria)]|nr:hypothetical protein [Bacillus sp. (in: firmicutes)]
MNNKIKQEINKIDIPKELSERSKLGISKAKAEMPNKKITWSIGIALAASLMIVFGSYSGYKIYLQNDLNSAMPKNNTTTIVTKDGGYQIPALNLPKTKNNQAMSMIGLIVYNGKIYTQSATEFDVDRAKDLLGEKLGTTKASIDEWSTQDKYSVEFASTIGEADVYTVQGYDKDFRIMSYSERDGEVYSEFYESLNGITVYDGRDIFGKLKIAGVIVNVQYRNYSDWYNSVDNYYSIEDRESLNTFIEELNNTVPYIGESIEEKLGDFRNEEEYKELTLQLKDGTKVKLVVIKGGYIHYGFLNLY